jgi:hypothetical protein
VIADATTAYGTSPTTNFDHSQHQDLLAVCWHDCSTAAPKNFPLMSFIWDEGVEISIETCMEHQQLE